MARTRKFVAAVALPLLASCSLLLDFDSLQAGTGGSAGMNAAVAAGSGGSGGSTTGGDAGESGATSGGSGGTGATGGSGGTAGAADCPSECFHDDPCELDGCNEDGGCLTGHVLGLALDGIDETIPADRHHRVTMVGGADAFYLSSFATKDELPEVVFYRLSRTLDDLTVLGTLGGLDLTSPSDPASAAGLAFVPVSGVVHAFVAMKDRVGLGAHVKHIVVGADKTPKPMPLAGLADDYAADFPHQYPVAVTLDGQPYAAWLTPSHTVALSDASNDPPTFLAATGNATTVALLGTSEDEPAVLYTTAGGGVFVERPELAPVALSECQPAPGEYISSSATFSNVAGFWLSTWTKVASAGNTGDGYLTTMGRGIFCSEDTCSGDMNACSDDIENNLARNPASVVAYRTGDPATRMELVQAIPFLATDGEKVTASLLLTQQSIDYGALDKDDPAAENIAPPLLLATQTAVAPDFRGPDLPAIAFAAPDRFAVAWTQPAGTGTGDELRLQRYKMCLPPPGQ